MKLQKRINQRLMRHKNVKLQKQKRKQPELKVIILIQEITSKEKKDYHLLSVNPVLNV